MFDSERRTMSVTDLARVSGMAAPLLRNLRTAAHGAVVCLHHARGDRKPETGAADSPLVIATQANWRRDFTEAAMVCAKNRHPNNPRLKPFAHMGQ
jgi:hypothetical protein